MNNSNKNDAQSGQTCLKDTYSSCTHFIWDFGGHLEKAPS